MQAHEKIIAALAIATVSLIAYQESRLNRIETAVISTQQEVKEVKRLISYGPPLAMSEKDLHCLALNIYGEAGIEPLEGKIAVGQVTINRLNSKRWGSTVCAVVYAHKQFSWTLYKPHPTKGPLWEASQKAALHVQSGAKITALDDSVLWYHADFVKPYWKAQKTEVAQLGRHIFYRRNA